MTNKEILGLKKAAIVLKAMAEKLESPSSKAETLALVKCVIKAVTELEKGE